MNHFKVLRKKKFLKRKVSIGKEGAIRHVYGLYFRHHQI